MTHHLPATDGDHPAPPRSPDRRDVLRAGGMGLLGAAFLAACGTDLPQAGVSGAAKTTTLVPPTVPVTKPSEAALAEDVVQLGTAASVELLVAKAYRTYGPKLTDGGLRDAAARFGDDHEAAANQIIDRAEVSDTARMPNEYLSKNLVDPIASTLTDDTAIGAFMAQLESTLVAVYLTATGVLTSATWRQQVMAFGAASARRVAVLGGPNGGGAPTEALYPLEDLIPADAYLRPEAEKPAGG